ncbi:CHASE2 domain-containing protein [Xylophilus rhododendri]|uniref:CHASE2 domain-containing protein n=1 Tax=Xylophilus rhododendri TaxID=2697032 RepID=A0A857J4U8_9BURK|nr:adenylate/guanylate cyclase domain-containing protein [Xylophilus rhododendri]QHI98990.1 CHASE2 domain-containing protein [Xylophilus rhododendri]
MGLLSRHGRRIALTLLPVLLALGGIFGGVESSGLERLDHFIYDTRLRATMPRSLDERVVVVDIDDRSLAEIGHWPWGRDRMAQLTQELFARQQAAVVGFDVLFGEADESSGLASLRRLAEGELRAQPGFAASVQRLGPALDYDQQFADALRERHAVLGYYFGHDRQASLRGVLPAPAIEHAAPGQPQPLLGTERWTSAGANIEVLARAAPQAGFMNSIPDNDGVIRSVALIGGFQGRYYESLALAMYRSLLGQPALLPMVIPGQTAAPGHPLTLEGLMLERGDNPQLLPVDERAAMLVSYRGRGGPEGGSFRYIPAVDLLTGRLPAGSLAGKLVLVGTTAPGLLDLRVTPVGRAYPGVETHANILSNLLDGRSLQRPDYEPGYTALTILLSGLLLALLLPMLSVPAGILLTLLTLAALGGLNFWLFAAQGLVLPLALSWLTVLAAFALNIGYGYFVETRSKRQLAQLFSTYVPRELVSEMVREPARYSMQAENRELTVMFCDMRGFTAMSETMEPQALQALLNRVFTRLTEIIRQERGTIDKYMGDCVMAFWGAPVRTSDHARLAVAAASGMVEAVHRMNQEHQAAGLPAIGIGIGLNTGVMCVGDMGSELRRSYTVIGDAVNLGSRLEGLCKVYGVEIVVGEDTHAKAAQGLAWLELDRVMVKGRQHAVTVFTPLAEESPAWLDDWNALLLAYRGQDWNGAARLLDRQDLLPPRFAALQALYAARLAEARSKPADADWDGTTRMDTK